MMVATVESRTGFATVRPQVLFSSPTPVRKPKNMSANGQKFLMLRAEASPEPAPRVIVNWFDELKRLVPVK